jgi:hypothetical protein
VVNLGLRSKWNIGMLEKWNNGFWNNGVMGYKKKESRSITLH